MPSITAENSSNTIPLSTESALDSVHLKSSCKILINRQQNPFWFQFQCPFLSPLEMPSWIGKIVHFVFPRMFGATCPALVVALGISSQLVFHPLFLHRLFF